MSIEAWVTNPAGAYLAHLDRSEASPFRRFAFTRTFGVGNGALQYHLDNKLVGEHEDLFGYGNLVWMRYRGRTRAWIVEERGVALDENEHQTDWVAVTGRGTKQLIGDRTIWPTYYSDATPDPSQWGLGGWKTKTNAQALLNQRVVPVVSTTAGAGATIGDPVEIVGGGKRQIGIIASIVVNVSVTLVDNLAFTFPSGSRVRSAASQWRRFVNRPVGEMLWDIVAESNPRFATQIVRGVVETTGADGWTQDFRFDNALDIVEAVEEQFGDVEMDGLTFNYRNAIGVDRTTTVILEEGADVTKLSAEDNDRDSLSWVVAEGTGHAVFSYLAPKKKLTRAQRRTAARKRAAYIAKHRKAPKAPKRKAILVKANYEIDLASEAVGIARRREAFVDAKDVSNLIQLDAIADAALEEHTIEEAVGLEVTEQRFQAEIHYGLGDWVRVIVPSRDFDEDVRIVSETFAETDDPEQVEVSIDVNSRRQELALEVQKPGQAARRSIGVQNRQPQGQMVPFSFGGADVFDTTDTMDVFLFVPDRMYVLIESRVLLRFREFFAAAKSAVSSGSLTSDSGGGSTSGASSASTSASANLGSHSHLVGSFVSSTPGAFTNRRYATVDGGGMDFNIETNDVISFSSGTTSIGVHDHTIAHTHTTPAHAHTVPGHTHTLVYGVQKEAYPASHSVTLKVYELEAGAWVLRGTIPALIADIEDLDLTAFIGGPGNWRLELKSDAAQPNGGRLGADVSGYVLGAIQSS